jgi:hypothetical protein
MYQEHKYSSRSLIKGFRTLTQLHLPLFIHLRIDTRMSSVNGDRSYGHVVHIHQLSHPFLLKPVPEDIINTIREQTQHIYQ